MNYVVGVDIGTQSTKALLISTQGAIVAQASVGYQVEQPEPLWAQQWPDVWLKAVYQAVPMQSPAAVSTRTISKPSVSAACTAGRAYRWTQR